MVDSAWNAAIRAWIYIKVGSSSLGKYARLTGSEVLFSVTGSVLHLPSLTPFLHLTDSHTIGAFDSTNLELGIPPWLEP